MYQCTRAPVQFDRITQRRHRQKENVCFRSVSLAAMGPFNTTTRCTRPTPRFWKTITLWTLTAAAIIIGIRNHRGCSAKRQHLGATVRRWWNGTATGSIACAYPKYATKMAAQQMGQRLSQKQRNIRKTFCTTWPRRRQRMRRKHAVVNHYQTIINWNHSNASTTTCDAFRTRKLSICKLAARYHRCQRMMPMPTGTTTTETKAMSIFANQLFASITFTTVAVIWIAATQTIPAKMYSWMMHIITNFNFNINTNCVPIRQRRRRRRNWRMI